jgi:hypothetical protein
MRIKFSTEKLSFISISIPFSIFSSNDDFLIFNQVTWSRYLTKIEKETGFLV